LRGSRKENLLKHLPGDYMEKIILQIPEDMRKLISDVIHGNPGKHAGGKIRRGIIKIY